MKKLQLEPTDYTPKIDFDPITNVLEIFGNSMPESSPEFYGEVYDWVVEFMDYTAHKIVMNFKLDYFNTSTSKEFYALLSKLKDHKYGVEVNWYFQEDDEQMEEDGIDLQEDTQVDFNFISYKL